MENATMVFIVNSPSQQYKQRLAATDGQQQPNGPMHKAARRCSESCGARCNGCGGDARSSQTKR